MSSNPIAGRVDWGQLWYPGPRRVFSADEMARAGGDGPSPTLRATVAFNALITTLAVGINAPRAVWLPLLLEALLMFGAGWASLRWLWWRPSRGPLMACTVVLCALLFGTAWVMLRLVPERETRMWLAVVLAGGSLILAVLLWVLVVWRSQQIEARLVAQAEREQAVEMARRLAAAQLEPHFLFNTLASLQHWVDTRDERASPLLAALTGYLRATLPMFKQPAQPLADELLAVERYLQVMQARLGARLAFSLDIEPGLGALPLPSGALLTLVENAVQHGVEPQVAGGRVRVAARRRGATLEIEVADDGPGPAPGWREGVGLANVRQRLELVAGAAAGLSIGPAAGGGCLARLTLPLPPGATA